jgi:hypothetical protein
MNSIILWKSIRRTLTADRNGLWLTIGGHDILIVTWDEIEKAKSQLFPVAGAPVITEKE